MDKNIISGAFLVLLILAVSCKNNNGNQIKSENRTMTDKIKIPKGSQTVNPLIATQDTRALIRFLENVFDAQEDENAFAVSDTDGKVFNSSVTIGDVSIIIFDRKEGWKHTPSFLQIYVNNINDKLDKAKSLGATITTRPTDFYGGKLARFIDPQGNLWWLYELQEYNESDWESTEDSSDEESTEWSTSNDPDMTYIHNSLVEAMNKLNEYE